MFKLKAAVQVSEERQPPANSDAMFQILSVFYLSSINLMGVKQPRYAVTSRAEKNGSNVSPWVRLKPGASMCLCSFRPWLKVVRAEVWKTGGFR